MKTLLKFKIVLLIAFGVVLFSCKNNNEYPQDNNTDTEMNEGSTNAHDSYDQVGDNIPTDTTDVNTTTPGANGTGTNGTGTTNSTGTNGTGTSNGSQNNSNME